MGTVVYAESFASAEAEINVKPKLVHGASKKTHIKLLDKNKDLSDLIDASPYRDDIAELLQSEEVSALLFTAYLCYRAYCENGEHRHFIESERRYHLVIGCQELNTTANLGIGLLYLHSTDQNDSVLARHHICIAAKASVAALCLAISKNFVTIVDNDADPLPVKIGDSQKSSHQKNLLPFNKSVCAQKFSSLIRSINDEDKLGLSESDIEDKAEQYADSLAPSTSKQTVPENPGPMPTKEELEAGGDEKGRLYRQVRTRSNVTIIDHLKNVWMPWIEAGILTMPELNKPNRDPSAYKALAAWRIKPGNNLKAALGYDIPSKSDIINSHIAATAMLPPGERPARLTWAMEKREKKTKVSSSKLPAVAPELFRPSEIDPETNRPKPRPPGRVWGEKEGIAEFLERVWYDPWIKEGVLTVSDLRTLDPSAFHAYYRARDSIPEHLRPLNKRQVIDAQIDAMGEEAVRESQRLGSAYYRRANGLVQK